MNLENFSGSEVLPYSPIAPGVRCPASPLVAVLGLTCGERVAHYLATGERCAGPEICPRFPRPGMKSPAVIIPKWARIKDGIPYFGRRRLEICPFCRRSGVIFFIAPGYRTCRNHVRELRREEGRSCKK